MSRKRTTKKELEHSEEKPKNHSKTKHHSKKPHFISIAVVFFAVGFFLSFLLYGSFVNAMTPEQAGNKALGFIKSDLLSEGVLAEIINISERSGVYELSMNISSAEGSAVAKAFISKDGKILFINAVEINESSSEPEDDGGDETGDGGTASACEATTTSDNPTITAFVVSFCPYGVQMQRIMGEIVNNIPELSDNIEVRYMGAVSDGEVVAMHGEEEAAENLRQICIREEQSVLFWDYMNCFIQEGDSESCLIESGVNRGNLQACMNTAERGIAYAQEDFSLQARYSVTGSPTLIMNGQRVSEFDFGGRTAEAVKSLLCCGFSQEPSECSEVLSTESAAVSFSPTYSGSSGSGSC